MSRTAASLGARKGMSATDLVLASGPHRAPDFVKDLAKAKLFGTGGPADERRGAGKEGVYCAAGDACAALIPSAGVPIPKAGEFAYKAGLALGKRLAAW